MEDGSTLHVTLFMEVPRARRLMLPLTELRQFKEDIHHSALSLHLITVPLRLCVMS